MEKSMLLEAEPAELYNITDLNTELVYIEKKRNGPNYYAEISIFKPYLVILFYVVMFFSIISLILNIKRKCKCNIIISLILPIIVIGTVLVLRLLVRDNLINNFDGSIMLPLILSIILLISILIMLILMIIKRK